ncbi:MAG: DUF3857 domain-containing protein, partial [Bacteroidetes bacterium]|nr:DUF3857 domain-containing protein [Bacteroidota bacterium]
MRSPLFFICFLLFSITVCAQDKDYAEKAAQFQKDIWGNPGAEFKATATPANMNNESAVVLARSYNALWTSGSRFKFTLMGAGLSKHMEKTIIFHERVKINDKTALENFSTIEYQKKLDNSTSFGITAKLRNTKNTFIGVKVIKPNGKEVTVNTSEEVLLKDETKDKKGKLAIPDLQVGDVLDYYIANVDVNENLGGESFEDNENVFILADEYPILSYNIDFQFDKKVKTKMIFANGAPHFAESHDKDDNQLLSLKLHNLPKYQSHLWTAPLRQYPYIEIGGAYVSSLTPQDKIISGQNSMFEGQREVLEAFFREEPGYDFVERETKDFFGSKKNLKNTPLDSVMKVMYDIW